MTIRNDGTGPKKHRGERRIQCLAIALALFPSTGARADEPARATGEKLAAGAPRKTVESIAKEVRDSIVTIRFQGRGGSDQGLGTGFVIGADGLIASNYHVIGEARPVSVELADGSRHDVTEIHASDRAADLAIVRIARQGLAPLALGAPETLADGAEVVAVGNPHGLERSVVAGRVSGKREIDGRSMIQLAIPIEPGNSGGPLLDMEGKVHGILTMKSLVTPFLGFAIGIDQLQPLIDKPNPVAIDRWLTIGTLDAGEWTTTGGARWRQRAGRIGVEGTGTGFGGRSLCLATTEPPPLPHDLAVWVKLDDEDGAAGLVFAADGADRHYGFYPTAGKLRLTRFDGPDVLSWKILDEAPSPHYRPGQWNHLRVRRTADGFSCFVNDTPVFQSTDKGLGEGKVGLAKFRDTKAEFRGFAVGPQLPPAAPPTEQVARIAGMVKDLDGAGAPPAELVAALVGEGAVGDAALAARADALDREAKGMRALMAQVQAKRTVEALAKEAAAEPIDLFQSALLVAALDNPDLDLAGARHDLDRLAAEVAKGVPEGADDAAKLAALDRVLFQELGFHGSRGDYYNRSNSYVNEVLDDREGIPITLALVYMELAKRLGVAIEGVGLPGHFLVRHAPAGAEPRWIDVFDGATILDRDGVAKLYRDLQGRDLTDDLLAPVGPKAILVRMINNLLSIATREDDAPAMHRYLDAILAVDPESGRDRVMRMLVANRLGRKDAARSDALWLLDRAPDEIDLAAVHRFLEALDQGGR
jgi:regulator of sirC expression with transglutaminase-like and TPR domain/S1-C subfamily serine protease